MDSQTELDSQNRRGTDWTVKLNWTVKTEEEKMGESKAHIGQSHGVLFDDCPYFGNRGRILL